MREILFRGKRACGDGWVDGCLINKDGYALIVQSDSVCHPVIPETVGQYTGFTDKNRRRIFEGDVVKGRYSLGFESPRVVGVVEYVAAEFVVKGVKQYSWLQKQLNCNFEVIGNKDDNPEMMEVRP